MSKLEHKIVADNQVVFTRHFVASPEQVYRAHTDPELLQQWCTGPDGWRMTVCISEPTPGGKIRFEWENEEGHSFYLTGENIEMVPFSKLVHVERMHLPDPTPDNHVTTLFEPKDGGTFMTMTMTLPSKEVLEAMLATGMDGGMEISYQRLEKLI